MALMEIEMAGYAVYEIWDTTASVPGGSIVSRHKTREEADAEASRLESLEVARQARPQMSAATARKAAIEEYGASAHPATVHQVVLDMTYRGRRAYRVQPS